MIRYTLLCPPSTIVLWLQTSSSPLFNPLIFGFWTKEKPKLMIWNEGMYTNVTYCIQIPLKFIQASKHFVHQGTDQGWTSSAPTLSAFNTHLYHKLILSPKGYSLYFFSNPISQCQKEIYATAFKWQKSLIDTIIILQASYVCPLGCDHIEVYYSAIRCTFCRCTRIAEIEQRNFILPGHIRGHYSKRPYTCV